MLTAISQSINRDLPLQFEKVMRKELAQFAPAVAQLVKEPLQQLEKALDRTVRGCRARERERERERERQRFGSPNRNLPTRAALWEGLPRSVVRKGPMGVRFASNETPDVIGVTDPSGNEHDVSLRTPQRSADDARHS